MCAEKLIFLGASALKARLPRHLNCGRWGCQQFKEKKEISGDNEKCAISGFSAIFRRKMHSLASPEIHDHKDGGCTGTVGTREACRRFHAGIQRVGAWLSAGWCQRVPKTRQQNDHGARRGERREYPSKERLERSRGSSRSRSFSAHACRHNPMRKRGRLVWPPSLATELRRRLRPRFFRAGTTGIKKSRVRHQGGRDFLEFPQ